jgi:hypothetical protein
MKRTISKTLLVALIAASCLCMPTRAEDQTDVIALIRSVYQTDRQAFITQYLPLTEKESADFWPLYRSYREDMEKLGDSLVKLVLEYKDLYPDLPDKDAERLLKQYVALEKEHGAKQAHYFKKAAGILPASKVLRWAQLENRMDLILRLQMASAIPIAPVTASDSVNK